MSSSRIVLGLDPGYAITGWGVVRDGHPLHAIDYGVIRTEAKQTMPGRLAEIDRNVSELFDRFCPDLVVVEKIYFGNLKTTGEGVLESRGVLLANAGKREIPFLELAPSTIKNAVTSSGRAKKNDVIAMVMKLLRITEKISPDDAADALAAAIAGIFAGKLAGFIAGDSGPGGKSNATGNSGL